MIKIINPGTKNRKECNFCGALLSYNITDIQKQTIERKDGENDNIILLFSQDFITCPQCGSQVIIEETKIG